MKKIWTLLKLDFKALLMNSNMGGRRNKRRAATGLGALILICAVMLYISGIYSFMFAQVLSPVGGLDIMLMLMATLGAVMMFVFTVFSAQGVVFGGKDKDLIFSLPVNAFTVMLSRVFAVYLENLVIGLFLAVPAGITYLVYGGAGGVGFLLMFLVGMAFLALLPTLLSLIVGFVISLISSRMPKKKLINNILYFVALALLMVFAFSLNAQMTGITQNPEGIRLALQQYVFPVALMQQAACNADLLALLVLIAISVLPFVALVYLFSRCYKKVITGLGSHQLRRDYKLREVAAGSAFGALLKKEFSRYTGSSIYLMNTAFGIVLMLGGGIYCLFASGQIGDMIAQIGLDTQVIFPMVLAVILFMVSTCCTTDVSISLEGKTLWILKEAPIDPMELFKAKILLNLLVAVPGTALSALLIGLAFHFTAVQILMLILLPALFSVLVAVFGLMVNLYLPKLDGTSDAIIVKQSMSAFIGIFGPMLLVIGLGLLYAFALSPLMAFEGFYALCCGVLALAIAALWGWMRKRGVKLFLALN
ncbi:MULTISPECIES: hypothetical protein [unclassified Clostridium]|uniref:hypothetical protein n=1 Tax=unclassified Clostridium TaxID=2614128 RepID=UPI00110640B9|nr:MULTISPECIES: hypothetical protein [unclassified Clostridium]